MKITFERILEIHKRHNLINEEFLSMCRSNDFNPFEDELIIKIMTTIIVTSIIMEFTNCISNKKQTRKPNGG